MKTVIIMQSLENEDEIRVFSSEIALRCYMEDMDLQFIAPGNRHYIEDVDGIRHKITREIPIINSRQG